MTINNLAAYIDHTLLDPLATEADIEQLCAQAEQWKFASVCIYPIWVSRAVELLYGKAPQVCTVIGFPTGAHTSATKLYEAQAAVDAGAKELDVVINLGWLKMGHGEALYTEMAAICETTQVTIKAILETSVLSTTEKQMAAEICLDAGVSFLKTSTGWKGGATVEDVKLLKAVAKDRIGVKASGGIRTYDQAKDLIEAGATRLGTSRGIEILNQQNQAD